VTTKSRTAPGAESTATLKSDLPLLTLGVLCASTSGPIIAAITAPALAIAFWRNGLGTVFVLPFALARRDGELARLSRRTLGLALFAGVVLAAHFAAYVPSLSYTTVASATALVCSQSVWAAVFSHILGERLPPAAWAGIGIALAGVLCVTGVDVSLDPRALFGDVLALLGGILGGAYIVTGSRVRRHLSTSTYTALCYGMSALLLFAVCLVTGQQLVGFSLRDWILIGALTVLAQMLGHTIFNHVLRSTSPTVVSLAILFTVPLATVIAAVLVGQTPSPAAIPALALLVAGIGLVIWSRGRSSGRDRPDADSNVEGP
jgi:drug/metabolite transporter (DMT)-like permease